MKYNGDILEKQKEDIYTEEYCQRLKDITLQKNRCLNIRGKGNYQLAYNRNSSLLSISLIFFFLGVLLGTM